MSQTNIGSYAYYKFGENAGFFKNGNVGVGLWYSGRNAAIAALEVNMKDWAMGFSYDFLTTALAQQDNRTGAPEIILGFRKFVGKAKKPVVPEAPKVEEQKPAPPAENKPADQQPQKEVPATEPKQEVKQDVPSKDQPAADTKKDEKAEEAGKEQAAPKTQTEPAVKPAKEEKDMTPEDLEKERARKRQVYMVPLGFRGTDPFGGSEIELTAQERAFLSKSVKFKKSVAEITTASAQHLNNVAKVLRKHPNLKIEIKGFGCDLGSDEINLKLSQSRADKVKAYLVKRKVNPRQLKAIGLGKLKPEDDIKVE